MKLVIEIDKDLYEKYKDNYYVDNYISSSNIERTFSAIAHGTPLPKRTIDADELLNRISKKAKIPSLSGDTVNGLCGATAIIYDMLNESEDKE